MKETLILAKKIIEGYRIKRGDDKRVFETADLKDLQEGSHIMVRVSKLTIQQNL